MATIDNGAVQSALERDDPDTLSRLLEDVDARAELNNGWFGLSQPPLTAARSTAVVDVLIELGADPALVGEWWGPGFGLRGVDPAVAAALVARGAKLTPHAAAGLGLEAHLGEILGREPALVGAADGDGGTHCILPGPRRSRGCCSKRAPLSMPGMMTIAQRRLNG